MTQTQQLPNAEDLERSVCGRIIQDHQAIYDVAGFLTADMFYSQDMKRIYTAMLDLYKANETIDILSVKAAVERRGWLNDIGVQTIAKLMQEPYGNVELHGRVIVEKWMLRRLIEISNKTFNMAHYQSIDPIQLYEDTQKAISEVFKTIQTAKIETIGDVKKQIVTELIKCYENGAINGMLTPVNALTSHTGGWQKSTLTIVAARPGMGKTAFALECCIRPALDGVPTAFFSLEMNNQQLVSRALASESNVNVQKIVTRKIDRYEIDAIDRCHVLDGLPLYVVDKPDVTIESFKTMARQLVREKGVQLIVLDYLQLMSSSSKGRTREQDISEISRGLKVLSRELNIPIIALSQLSRAVESREDRKPQLSDLRESGAIEQDADNVIFLFRPEYYGFQTYELNGQQYPAQELIIIIIGKYRNGSLGEIKARWIGEITKITDYQY